MSTSKNSLTGVMRRAIDEHEYSLLALAKATGLPYSVVHGFANGNRTVTLKTAERLCDALGLTLVPKQSKQRKAGRAGV